MITTIMERVWRLLKNLLLQGMKKKGNQTSQQQLMPVIPATQKAEIKRIMVQSQAWQIPR
jgi:hypothetical protein